MKENTAKAKKIKRQKEALERQAAYDKLTVEEKRLRNPGKVIA